MNIDYEKNLKNIIKIPIKNFEEQYSRLIKLDKLINKNIGLIVIDSFSMFYRKEVQGNNKEINLKAVECLRSLKHICRENILVLVTSQVSENENGITPVGGKMIKNISDNILELKIKPRKIIFKKPVEKENKFEIKNEGVSLV